MRERQLAVMSIGVGIGILGCAAGIYPTGCSLSTSADGTGTPPPASSAASDDAGTPATTTGSSPSGDDAGSISIAVDSGAPLAHDGGSIPPIVTDSGMAADAAKSAPPPVCPAGLPAAINDLASEIGGSTVSTITPMGIHYETPAMHVVTAAEEAFLSDATQEPAIPASTSGLHLGALPVTLYPSKGGTPSPADINQHAIGNCDGDTAMASIAYQNPAYLASLITDNHDGTFTVAMFDPMAKPIKVTLDSQFLVDSSNDIGAVSGKNGVADWGTVLEKATMKYNQVYGVVPDIGGIGSEFQTPMLTGVGGSFSFNRGQLAPADLTRVVEASLAVGKLISGGFGVDGMALPNGFETVTAHGYAVFVPADTSTMVSMRNPWGLVPTASGYDSSTDGVMNIPIDPTWSAQIDLRIIDPGAACSGGETAPYVPMAKDVATSFVHVSEPHAARSARPANVVREAPPR